ncbi:acyl-CoA thioesterase [Pseudonocardia sp. CA-107938]|uniref:acyl-CoA thioesterase n=1 Tax=Pseudonocardia sp. CA-107938 TaxID=3240021 RepID=UPI003D94C00D
MSTAQQHPPLVHTVRIRPADTDHQGIVHASKYAAFFEAAFIEALREIAGSLEALGRHGVDLVMAEITIRYRSPARFDDLLDVAVLLRHIGTTSLVIDYRGTVNGRDVVLASARYVAFTSGLTKTAIPGPLRATLERIPRAPDDVQQAVSSPPTRSTLPG